MAFRPGMYTTNDHGGSTDPAWSPYLDNAETWLTGSTAFAPGFYTMQYMGPYVFNTSFEDWTLAGAVNACARAYAWASAQPNRRIIFRTAPGFAGGKGGGGPYGKAGFDAVANGTWTTMTQNMISTLWNAGGAGARPGLLPYVIIDPWWEMAAPWFNWSFSSTTGGGFAGTGDWRASVLNAFRKYIGDAKAKETALTGAAPQLKFGFSWSGDTDTVRLSGYPMTTGGPEGTGVYPGDSYIDYISGDLYTNGSFLTAFPEMRAFAEAHGKKLVVPEFGWFGTAFTTEAQDLTALHAFHDEVASHSAWEGIVEFNTNAGDGDSWIFNYANPSSPTPLAAAKPNALAYFRSAFGAQILQPGGGGSSAITNVVATQVGASTVRFTGNVTNDILNVVIYTDNTHATKKGEGAPVAGSFSIDIPNIAPGSYTWDAAGWNVPAQGTGPPTPAIIAENAAVAFTVVVAPTITIGAASTSGTTRTIPFTTSGTGILNVVASENGVKLSGTNDVTPVAGAGTIVVTGLTNGAHDIELDGWNVAAGGIGSIIATAHDTFTIVTQPTADDFDGATLNTVLWTVDKPTGDPSSVAVGAGNLIITIPQVDVTDPTTRGDNASISVGSAFSGGYTVLTGAAELKTNAIHDTNTSGTAVHIRAEQDLGTPDMSAEVLLASITTSGTTDVEYGVLARVGTGATPNFYMAFLAVTAGPVWDVYLFKHVAGVDTLLATSATHVGAPNTTTHTSEKLRIECVGTKITVFLDDAQVLSVTDSSITTGNFGGLRLARAAVGVDVAVKNPRVASYYHQNYITDRSVGIRQTVANGDFPAHEVRFRVPTASVSGVGVAYLNSSTGDRILAYVFADNSGIHFLATSVTGGVATNYVGSVPVFTTPEGLLQVSRVGNVWSFWTASSDGSNRISHGQAVFAMTVDRIKLFAINQPAA